MPSLEASFAFEWGISNMHKVYWRITELCLASIFHLVVNKDLILPLFSLPCWIPAARKLAHWPPDPSASSKTHRLGRRRPDLRPLPHPPSSGEPWVRCPRSDPRHPRLPGHGHLEHRGSDICHAEWGLPLLRWEQRGDLYQRVQGGFQLPPWVLLWCEQRGQGFHQCHLAGRLPEAAHSSHMPAASVAAAPQWQLLQDPLGHLPPGLLHRTPQAPEWRAAHSQCQELHRQ